MAIYVQRNSQRLGPYTVAEVRSQLASGALSLKDHVWWTGQEGWIPLVGSPVLKPDFVDSDPAMRKKGDGPTGLSPFSVAAVIAGLIFPMAFFTSVPAIVFGHCALGDIKKNRGRTGRRLAIIGLVLGYFFTLVWGATVGCFFYYRDDIEEMNMRQEAVDSQPFVPTKAPPVVNLTPAVNAAPPPAPAVAPAIPAAPPVSSAPATNAAPAAVAPGK